jgi:diaminopimelate epimerase
VAAILKDLTDPKVKVRTSMGVLEVEWKKQKVHQSGPAEIVLEGNYVAL